MKAAVYVYDESGTHPPLAELATAHDIDRAYALASPGRAVFRISQSEATDRDVAREGRMIVILSTENVPPWVGRLDALDFNGGDRTIEITCADWRQILYERITPVGFEPGSGSGASIAFQALREAGGRNSLGVWPLFREPGGWIAGGIRAGGKSLGALFDELAAITDDDWWLDYDVRWSRVEIYLRWSRRRGRDRAAALHLLESAHLARATYGRDALAGTRAVVAIGGGGDLSDRPAAIRASAQSARYLSLAAVPAEPASVTETRQAAARSPTLAREAVTIFPQITDVAVLALATRRALERPLMAAESLALTVAAGAGVAWADFGLGDTIRVKLASANFGGIDRSARIVGVQPDEAAGELDLALEVQ